MRLFEFIETSTKFFMVMTHCPGGDFFDFLAYRGSVTEEEARVLFLQVSLSCVCVRLCVCVCLSVCLLLCVERR